MRNAEGKNGDDSKSSDRLARNILVRLIKNKSAHNAPVTISVRRRDIAEMAGLTVETTIR